MKRLVKKILAHILIWGILISCIGPTVSVEAATESENVIERAVNWLKNNQNDDGSWGNNETNFLDTSVVSEYISENMVIGESLQQAISWMEGIQILNNDMAARILPYIKDTEKHTSIKNSLIINQNNDGGWGISKGYESDMLDTIIVLNTLRTEENVDVSILKNAVTYIMNMQHTNGSWSFTSLEETAASLTAQTVITLNSFHDNTNLMSDELQTVMRKAGEYLVSIQNADRTWGTDESSIIGTLLAYRAVLNTIGSDAVDTVAASILDVQNTDGSWYGSPYITALAIIAIKENINMPFAKINSIKLFKYIEETRTECYSYNANETFEIDADCVYSTADSQLLYFIKQKDGSVSSALTDGIPGWNTRNYMPGDYSVVVQIKDNLSGKIIASRETQFVINPSFAVENVTLSTDPENTRINSSCSVNAQTTLFSNSNINKTLILKTSVIDGDIVVKDDSQIIELSPEDQIKTVTSINFSPSVLTSKDYLIKTEVFEGTTKLAQGETTFHVLPAPSPTRVDVSQSLDKPVLFPGQDSVTAQFKLMGEGTPETPQRNPIDMILCIDDSGSMEWGNDDWSITKPWRIDFAKEASIHVIDLLQTNDRGAVVEFAGSTWIQQNITYDKPLLKTKISKTPASPWDGTSIGRGLQSANSILSTNSSDARSKVIVLLSDGGENVWTLSSVINQANIAKQNGYQIYTIGLGAGADQNLLSTLANITGGKYVYSPTMEQLDQMMTELAGEIFDTAGKNVILETTIPLNGMTVDTTKIVPAPTTSTYNSDGSMTLNWTFDKLVMGDEKIFEIYYEGTNLISGKEVILTKNTKLTYQDGNDITVTENLEDLKIPVNECMLDSKVVTDKTSYTANENVNITNVVQNLTDHPSTINGKVEIVDNKGTIVETIPETETNTWAAGETKTIDFTWNTGLTMAGTYKARISWSEGEKPISSSEVSFEIISDATVSCKISVDKLNYSANEDVNISEIIQNNSLNNIESGLTIRTCLYNSKGEQVWNSEDTLLELLPTDHTVLKNVWNTAKNVPDQYIMVMEVYKNNIKLTENNTIFKISSDMEGVSEISGSLKVLKNNCYPSDNVRFSYEINNTGNVKLNDITARIRIIDTSSETILDTITDKINIDISSSVAAQKIWMHDALKTGVYMVVLDAILADGDEVTLGSGYINVENPYDTTIRQVVRPRVLVWAESQNNINLANQTLEEMQVYYNVVSSREAFMSELRTKKYNLYMLLDSSLPLTGDEDKELAAEVAQGKGIIASRDSNGDNLKNLDLFGVSFNGSTTPGDYTVSFQNDSVFNQFTLSGTGKAQTITLDGGQQLATLYSKKGTSPAVVTNNYQNGKSILFTFDIGSCSGELTNIMKKSIELVSPSSDLNDRFAEIEVKVHALTSIRAKISLNIPQGAEVIWTSPDTSMWEFDAIEGQDYILRYLLELPQIAGQYPVILDSYYESSEGILKFETNEVNLLKQ